MAYMNVVEGKYMMKNGVKDTLFGLIGKTKGHTEVRSLGGIVDGGAPDAPKPSGLKKEKVADKTERHIGGKNATHIPGAHHGMVPYPGAFMARVGKKL
jgi:hypothetical protein